MSLSVTHRSHRLKNSKMIKQETAESKKSPDEIVSLFGFEATSQVHQIDRNDQDSNVLSVVGEDFSREQTCIENREEEGEKGSWHEVEMSAKKKASTTIIGIH